RVVAGVGDDADAVLAGGTRDLGAGLRERGEEAWDAPAAGATTGSAAGEPAAGEPAAGEPAAPSPAHHLLRLGGAVERLVEDFRGVRGVGVLQADDLELLAVGRGRQDEAHQPLNHVERVGVVAGDDQPVARGHDQDSRRLARTLLLVLAVVLGIY